MKWFLGLSKAKFIHCNKFRCYIFGTQIVSDHHTTKGFVVLQTLPGTNVHAEKKESPCAPGSFVLSTTTIFFAVLGITSNNLLGTKGLYRCTFYQTYFSAFCHQISMVSSIASQAEPIAIHYSYLHLLHHSSNNL